MGTGGAVICATSQMMYRRRLTGMRRPRRAWTDGKDLTSTMPWLNLSRHRSTWFGLLSLSYTFSSSMSATHLSTVVSLEPAQDASVRVLTAFRTQIEGQGWGLLPLIPACITSRYLEPAPKMQPPACLSLAPWTSHF